VLCDPKVSDTVASLDFDHLLPIKSPSKNKPLNYIQDETQAASFDIDAIAKTYTNPIVNELPSKLKVPVPTPKPPLKKIQEVIVIADEVVKQAPHTKISKATTTTAPIPKIVPTTGASTTINNNSIGSSNVVKTKANKDLEFLYGSTPSQTIADTVHVNIKPTTPKKATVAETLGSHSTMTPSVDLDALNFIQNLSQNEVVDTNKKQIVDQRNISDLLKKRDSAPKLTKEPSKGNIVAANYGNSQSNSPSFATSNFPFQDIDMND